MKNAIICRNIIKSVSINQSKEMILKLPSFVVNKGEQIALMGPSGSGKTTLLNLMAGLDLPIEGSVEVFGEVLSEKNERERSSFRGKYIGMVFQEFRLFPYMTSIENILVQGMVKADLNKRESVGRARELLCMVGMEDRINHKAGKLSKGQQQRVAIARALFHCPKLLLVDEPTSNLDARTGLEVTRLLKRLSEELDCTLVIVTHDRVIAGQFQRIEYMDQLNQIYSEIITEGVK